MIERSKSQSIKGEGSSRDSAVAYSRDNRSVMPDNEITSKIMSSNRGKDTGPELLLRRALREAGIPGYRLQWKKVPGRPDIAYPGKKVAIFVNGCFWHRCPKCNLPLPKTHTEFWVEKFDRNVKRDKEKSDALSALGWTVITAWECELKEDPSEIVEMIINHLD